MPKQKEGAATRQSYRANNPAIAGKTRPSVAQLEARRMRTVEALQGALGLAVLCMSAIVWD